MVLDDGSNDSGKALHHRTTNAAQRLVQRRILHDENRFRSLSSPPRTAPIATRLEHQLPGGFRTRKDTAPRRT